MRRGGLDTYRVAEMRVDADVDVDADAGERLQIRATHGDILHGKDTPDTVAHRTTPWAHTAVARVDSGTRSTQAEGT
jgi:hypothetical protein